MRGGRPISPLSMNACVRLGRFTWISYIAAPILIIDKLTRTNHAAVLFRAKKPPDDFVKRANFSAIPKAQFVKDYAPEIAAKTC